MSFWNKFGKMAHGRMSQPGADNGAGDETLDGELERALTGFRLSVRAWSEDELSRPRTMVARSSHGWRLVAGWALGCALVAGGFSGGLYERHHKVEMAKIAAAQEAEHQKQLAAQRAQEEEDLLARVDSDIAREVPSAMEPLAQLMDADETK
jgi:hypothetical protein